MWFEILRWGSIILCLVATVMNVVAFVRCRRLNQKQKILISRYIELLNEMSAKPTDDLTDVEK